MAKKQKKAHVEVCPKCGSEATPYNRDEYDTAEEGSFERLQLCTNKDCRNHFWDRWAMTYIGQEDCGPVNIDDWKEGMRDNGLLD